MASNEYIITQLKGNEMAVKQSLKDWLKKHPEEILVTTVAVSGTVLFVVAIVASAKEQNKAIAAYNEYLDNFNKWINEETQKGNCIYQLVDGSFLTVPTDTPRERVLK